MKRALITIIPVFFMAFGCEHIDVVNSIHGNWKIVSISGTLAGSQDIRDFDHLVINNQGYQVLFNNDVIQDGFSEIQKKDTGNNGKEYYFLLLKESHNNHPNSNFYSNYPLKISFDGENSLTLSQYGITDGFVYHFVKD
jgi:hypothetical protein